MYKLHLILKYLRKRRIAWVSLAAVTLCTAMVLVVISVMGGWVNMFLKTSQELEGDIIITRMSDTGFAHYDEIMDQVRKLPQVTAAVPAIITFGLANFDGQYRDKVEVRAYGDLDQVGKVNSFFKGLYRQYQEPMEEIDQDTSLSAAEKAKRKAELIDKGPSFDKPLDAETYKEYLPGKNIDASTLPGCIPGTRLIILPGADGKMNRGPGIYTDWVQLTVGDLRSVESVTPSLATSTYWIIDDCKTNFFPVDQTTIYVPFDKLQRDAGMAAENYMEKVDGQLVPHVDPARVSEIEVGVAEPAKSSAKDLAAVCAAIQKIVDDVQSKYELSGTSDPVEAQTWDQKQAQYTGAILHEEVLLVFLFGIVSVVAFFLIFCVFYMIVAEKTRDIGIIKSVGASNMGVAEIFLGYGLTIGVLGGGAGFLLAYLVVHNINQIHAWLGRELGIVIWDPRTYIFETIPNVMQARDIAWIVSVAILSAVLGAMIPAIRAARLNPVEAFRWE